MPVAEPTNGQMYKVDFFAPEKQGPVYTLASALSVIFVVMPTLGTDQHKPRFFYRHEQYSKGSCLSQLGFAAFR